MRKKLQVIVCILIVILLGIALEGYVNAAKDKNDPSYIEQQFSDSMDWVNENLKKATYHPDNFKDLEGMDPESIEYLNRNAEKNGVIDETITSLGLAYNQLMSIQTDIGLDKLTQSQLEKYHLAIKLFLEKANPIYADREILTKFPAKAFPDSPDAVNEIYNNVGKKIEEMKKANSDINTDYTNELIDEGKQDHQEVQDEIDAEKRGDDPMSGILGNSTANATHTPDEIIGEAKNFIDTGKNGGQTINGENLILGSSTLYNLLLSIGIFLAVAIGMFLGVKFMTSSVEDKAKVKEALIPYIAGCIIVFGAFVIWKLAINLLSGIDKVGYQSSYVIARQIDEK